MLLLGNAFQFESSITEFDRVEFVLWILDIIFAYCVVDTDSGKHGQLL